MVSFGFFNSSNGDRRYSSEDISRIFSFLITDGVLMTYGDKFFTTPSTSNLGVILGTGWAWFNHTWTMSDAKIPFALSEADPSLDRIDTIYLKVDARSLGRVNTLGLLEGSPALNPKAPTFPTETDVYYHPLAYIRVRKNVTRIAASDIEILAGKTKAPFITSILQTTDITTLFQGWSEQFGRKMTEWENELDTLETSLTSNVDALISRGNQQLSTQQSQFTAAQTARQNTFNTSITGWETEFRTWFDNLQTYLSQDVVTAIWADLDKLDKETKRLDALIPKTNTSLFDLPTLQTTNPDGYPVNIYQKWSDKTYNNSLYSANNNGEETVSKYDYFLLFNQKEGNVDVKAMTVSIDVDVSNGVPRLLIHTCAFSDTLTTSSYRTYSVSNVSGLTNYSGVRPSFAKAAVLYGTRLYVRASIVVNNSLLHIGGSILLNDVGALSTTYPFVRGGSNVNGVGPAYGCLQFVDNIPVWVYGSNVTATSGTRVYMDIYAIKDHPNTPQLNTSIVFSRPLAAAIPYLKTCLATGVNYGQAGHTNEIVLPFVDVDPQFGIIKYAPYSNSSRLASESETHPIQGVFNSALMTWKWSFSGGGSMSNMVSQPVYRYQQIRYDSKEIFVAPQHVVTYNMSNGTSSYVTTKSSGSWSFEIFGPRRMYSFGSTIDSTLHYITKMVCVFLKNTSSGYSESMSSSNIYITPFMDGWTSTEYLYIPIKTREGFLNGVTMHKSVLSTENSSSVVLFDNDERCLIPGLYSLDDDVFVSIPGRIIKTKTTSIASNTRRTQFVEYRVPRTTPNYIKI